MCNTVVIKNFEHKIKQTSQRAPSISKRKNKVLATNKSVKISKKNKFI